VTATSEHDRSDLLAREQRREREREREGGASNLIRETDALERSSESRARSCDSAVPQTSGIN